MVWWALCLRSYFTTSLPSLRTETFNGQLPKSYHIDKLREERLELSTLANSVHASTVVLAAICDVFALPKTMLSKSELG